MLPREWSAVEIWYSKAMNSNESWEALFCKGDNVMVTESNTPKVVIVIEGGNAAATYLHKSLDIGADDIEVIDLDNDPSAEDKNKADWYWSHEDYVRV